MLARHVNNCSIAISNEHQAAGFSVFSHLIVVS